MKTTRILTICFLVLGLLACLSQSASSESIGTAFTYQGQLYDANCPANGLYDFAFKLYDAGSDGNKVGSDVNVGDVNVIDGYFTVELNFGSGVFDGEGRWLEVDVRPGDSNDPNGYTTLSPRQEVTPTPYALYAKNTGGINDGNSVLPTGVIVMWSGSIATIPEDWALCDGNNNTPDLRDRFVVGAGSTYAVAATGGEAMHTLTIAEIPAHTHNYDGVGWRDRYDGGDWWSPYPSQTKTSASTGGDQPHENRPPYYALAFIMKL